MNKVSRMAACFGLLALLVLPPMQSSLAAHHLRRGKLEGSFNMIGTVSKHPGATSCMQGNILYDLNSADHKTTAPLSTSSKSDEDILERASNSKGWVRVEGLWETGVETGCRWVKVTRVTSATKG